MFQRHGNLNVLHIVLGYRKNFIIHVSTLRTTTVTHDLEAFINGRTALGGDCSRSSNITIGIQSRTGVNGDGTASVHDDVADRADGRTGILLAAACSELLSGQGQCSVDRQIRTLFHGQGTEEAGFGISGVGTRFGSVGSTGCIKRNKECDTGRDSVISCFQCMVIIQNNLFAARCSRSECIIPSPVGFAIYQIRGDTSSTIIPNKNRSQSTTGFGEQLSVGDRECGRIAVGIHQGGAIQNVGCGIRGNRKTFGGITGQGNRACRNRVAVNLVARQRGIGKGYCYLRRRGIGIAKVQCQIFIFPRSACNVDRKRTISFEIVGLFSASIGFTVDRG